MSNKANEFSNMHVAEDHLMIERALKKKKGCYVTRRKGIFLFILALLACILVGLVVYFAHPGWKNENMISTSTKQSTLNGTTMIKYPNVRIPSDIIPIHYTVRLRPDIYSDDPKDFHFNGTVEMTFTIKSSTNKIFLHWRLLDIETENIKVYQLASLREMKVDYSKIQLTPSPYEFIEIPMRDMLMKDDTYKINVAYHGVLQKDLKGIYYSDYISEDGTTVYLLTSQLQSTDARKTFPCMDEPALKATFDIIIERRTSKHSKSNTRQIRSESMNGGWIADYYETTPRMSTYLLAFLVSDFECVHNYTKSGKLVEVCARPTAFTQTEFAMSIVVNIQEWYEWYNNIDYPLNKTTHVALPDFSAGAMENWGLITYRETALLYDSFTSSTADKQSLAAIISHELAHMWFGDIVTPEWWDDVWLNEGFASYMQLWGVHNVKNFDSWKIEEQFVVEYLQNVMEPDSLVSSHPVYLTIDDPLSIAQLFDDITYNKGASIIRMMKYFLGENTFRWGLSNYLKDRSYQAAGHHDLFQFLTKQSKIDGSNLNVSAIMNTWILQMGYPVVTFDYQRQGSKIALSQGHFLIDSTSKVSQTSPYDYLWMVPISYMTDQSGQPNFNELSLQWLNEATGLINNVPTNLKWVIGNVGETFFYRVNYNEENWNSLAQQLITDHTVIPTTSRAQLIDDSFKLGRSGHIKQSISFEIAQYIVKEREYTPWYALSFNMQYVSQMLYTTTGIELLQKYMQDKVGPVYSSLGWNEDLQNESHLDKRLRVMILSLACTYHITSCVTEANSLFQQWMEAGINNKTYELSPNFAATIYCDGIYSGGLKEWDFAYQMFLKSNSGSQKNALLSGLACTKESWLLQRYLEWAFAEDEYGIGQQDMKTVLISVARNPVGTHMAWNFFKANWHTFFERFGSVAFTFTEIIKGLTETFSSEWELSDLENFVASAPQLGTGERAFQQAIEKTRINVLWRTQNEKDIISWLNSSS